MYHTIKQIALDWDSYLKLNKNRNILFCFLVLFHNPGMFFSLLYRVERYLIIHKSIMFKLVGYLLFPVYFLTTYFILDIDIDPRVEIGGGLYLHNKGIVIAHTAKVGKFAHIVGPVTIGTKSVQDSRSPKIGDRVTIGTGARIIGGINIGNEVTVGANAVVVNDVPNNCTVVGVPARIVKR